MAVVQREVWRQYSEAIAVSHDRLIFGIGITNRDCKLIILYTYIDNARAVVRPVRMKFSHISRACQVVTLSRLGVDLESGDLPVRARLYTAIFKPGMKLLTVRAEPWE